MGLTFTVAAAPESVLEDEAGVLVRGHLDDRFPGLLKPEPDSEPWYSDELGWSGWAKLQERVGRVLGADRAPHFLSMEAWFGVYLPCAVQPDAIEVVPDEAPLDIASLPGLIAELVAFGRAENLPTNKAGLKQLAEKYLDDDELVDSDMDVQTYAQLLLAAFEAAERAHPLWIVK